MAPPVGIQLSPKYTIGELIGEGAFGKVHAVVGMDKKWAIKLCAVPTKTTAKKKSRTEIIHERLAAEYELYKEMRHLWGNILPIIPLANSDISSWYDNLASECAYYYYRCLVMERMDGLLMDALSRLLQASSKGIVQLGPMACKLVDICEEIHKTNHILLDVKPDNLMTTSSSSSKAKLTPQSFADSIRLIDLGLVKKYGGAYGHKENEGTTEVQGTPLYASLNNHEHETPSRRDDIESMLYILGEVVLMCCNATIYAPNSATASCLPWSQEGSDETIGNIKRAAVLDLSSKNYYGAMPKAAAKILYEALQQVRSYKYTATPDYDQLRALLNKLQVSSTTAKSSSKKSSATANQNHRNLQAQAACPFERLLHWDFMSNDGSVVEQGLQEFTRRYNEHPNTANFSVKSAGGYVLLSIIMRKWNGCPKIQAKACLALAISLLYECEGKHSLEGVEACLALSMSLCECEGTRSLERVGVIEAAIKWAIQEYPKDRDVKIAGCTVLEKLSKIQIGGGTRVASSNVAPSPDVNVGEDDDSRKFAADENRKPPSRKTSTSKKNLATGDMDITAYQKLPGLQAQAVCPIERHLYGDIMSSDEAVVEQGLQEFTRRCNNLCKMKRDREVFHPNAANFSVKSAGGYVLLSIIMRKWNGYPKIQAKACLALASSLYECEGVIEAISWAMQEYRKDRDVQNAGCAALAKLSEIEEGGGTLVANSNVASLIIAAAKNFPVDLSVQQWASCALLNMAVNGDFEEEGATIKAKAVQALKATRAFANELQQNCQKAIALIESERSE